MTRRDPNFVDVHVGSRIRMRRQFVGMSQEKLGELLGITFQQVQKYEKGSNRISASRLYYTAKILGVPVQFFFEELPGSEERTSQDETREQDTVLSSLMNAEGIVLAKAFREADNSNKRKLIASVARLIAEAKD
ncbi:MAG: helix-turn-helix transcriptional regulator [Alphaproteobacteria bacterium]|jgi:transcriptional regulator with XRE-family HTH domain|nr:helix-turn-helix transcriptional regulator [Alphaproteobacteria bacterium]